MAIFPTAPGRIVTGESFMETFEAPDWLIDGIVQRGRLYACTSLTGHGKTAVWLFNACMIHAGREVGGLEVCKGNVLILAGENPEDLKARMWGMVRGLNLQPHEMPFVLPRTFPLTDDEADTLKKEIMALGVPLALIIGDTAASFFPGEDENDNVQAGAYARTLRSFSECDGMPAVVVLSHPVKNATRQNLLPRGGGAFLNELDGNLTLWSASRGEATELHWHGKIRGPDFQPLTYKLRSVDTGYRDKRDRPVMTIIAEPQSEDEAAEQTREALADEDVVLVALRDDPGIAIAQICLNAGWTDPDGHPDKKKAYRAMESLREDKLIQQERARGPWTITDKGKRMINGSGKNYT